MQDQYITKFWNYHKNAAFIKSSKDGGVAAKGLCVFVALFLINLSAIIYIN